MIRMVVSSSAAHAKGYFSDALLKSDYYLDDQELQGRLKGKLADRIGAGGVATRDNFFALCENRNPLTGEALTPRTKEARRVGYDVNFHCPKSVSLVHALSKDDHIMAAFQSAVQETMTDIEADSKARVRKGGKFEDRDTGELLWAEFVHQTARPVDGSVPDPHLHAHCFVFNGTYDAVEKKTKAGEFGSIKRDMPYYQARFHKKFSDKLIGLGYDVKRTQKSFELVGVPQSAIDLFSKRTNEIGEFAKVKGITDAKELDKLGALTRSKKQKGLTMGELKAEWRRQIREHTNFAGGEKDSLVRNAPKKERVKILAEDCIDHALEHSFERASVMADRRLLATAYRHGIGDRSVTAEAITGSFKQDKRIIRIREKDQDFCTTREILTEEKKMVDLAREGMEKLRPLYATAPEMDLKGQQADAAAHILTTKDQVTIVRGAAGAGKTTMMKETVGHIERAGKKVTVVAPTAQASRGVLAKEGFKQATTVAKLLIDKEMQEGLKNQVLMVDEAGLLGTRDMSGILSLAKQQDAWVILVGDTRQHASVDRGDALRILNTVGGIRTAEVSRIFRQKNVQYLSAVQDLSNGDIRTGFDKLDKMGFIKTVDPMKPNDTLVDDYIKAAKNKRSTLVVSPTHEQGEAVTDKIRKKLRFEKLLGKKEVAAKKLTNTNMTLAEKSDLRNYRVGQIVKFNQHVKNIKRGTEWEIKEVSRTHVKLADGTGVEHDLPNSRPKFFDVFNRSEIGLSKGDRVRITRNSFDEGEKWMDNGQSLEVVSVKKTGKIGLVNRQSKVSYVLDKGFGHLAHDYCTTSHSAQGKTVDEVFISQPASTFDATNAKQFYVSLSRGRHRATVYTDDRTELLEHAARIGDRQSAMELVAGNQKHVDFVIQREREKYQSNTPTKTPKERTAMNNPNKDRDHEPRV